MYSCLFSLFPSRCRYEAGVPFERAADCLKILGDAIYGPEKLYEGFRTANNIRFISGEDFYLSPANGGPVMYINFEASLQCSGWDALFLKII